MANWSGTARAYDASFARLCAGSIPNVIGAVGRPSAGAKALDAGCGPGRLTGELTRAGFTSSGVDADEEMIRVAGERHPDLQFSVAALPDLPFRSGSFDAVTANFVINHVPDPLAAVRDMGRILHPGGVAAVTVWPAAAHELNEFWNRLIRESHIEWPAGDRLDPRLDFDRTAPGCTELLERAGFASVRSRTIRWVFRIRPDDLWLAPAAGIARIGRVLAGQDDAGRRRMRAAFQRLATDRLDGEEVAFEVSAILSSGRVPSGPRR